MVKKWSRKSNACWRPSLCHVPWRMPRPRHLESAFGPGLAPKALVSGPGPRSLALGLSPSAPRTHGLSPTGFRALGPRPLGPLTLVLGPWSFRMACYWPKLNARWPYICQSFFMHRICPLSFAAVRLFRVPCRQSAYDQQQCGLRSSSKKSWGV